jgi:hypothetical protein
MLWPRLNKKDQGLHTSIHAVHVILCQVHTITGILQNCQTASVNQHRYTWRLQKKIGVTYLNFFQ